MWLFSRKGSSGFSGYSTAEEVTQEIIGNGLTAIVTGATSGIGAETARVLALRGVHVIMAVRNMAAARDVKEVMERDIPSAKIDAMELDLSSMASVRKFASEFNSSGLPLNLLMYHSLSAYGQSKLANVLHANELARRLKEDGVEITANSVHPGVVDTDIFRHHSLFRGLVNLVGQLIVKSVQQGAATTCYVALHPNVKGVCGKYFGDCDITKASSQSNDADLARKLWDFSTDLVK
uniref:Uncharacterized protein n=1 Tax=Chenopodium quinoa TaxID=63459 RepID=A0A803M0A0_CHEQI